MEKPEDYKIIKVYFIYHTEYDDSSWYRKYPSPFKRKFDAAKEAAELQRRYPVTTVKHYEIKEELLIQNVNDGSLYQFGMRIYRTLK